MKLFWTKESLLRLQEIEDYIAKDNPSAAIKFSDKLISLAKTIIHNPRKGRIVPELSLENIREVLYKNYRIVYLIKENSINVLTIFEGHKLLNEEDILSNSTSSKT